MNSPFFQAEVLGGRTTITPQTQAAAPTARIATATPIASPPAVPSPAASSPAVPTGPLNPPPSTVTVPPVSVPAETAKKSGNGKYRVMFCGTYPIGQSNGYSRVVYYIAKFLGKREDIQLTVYGFQNYKQTAGSDMRNDIPSSVILHDALATEDPKRSGFGEKEVAAYLKQNPQDMVVIFNDMVITSALVQNIMTQMTPDERKAFKLVSYMDQVYPYQKKQYIDMLNTYFDAVITFTPYWRKTARKLGLKPEVPCYVLPHGFDHHLYYPIPKNLARMYFSLPEDAFTILNLNRNQPRKRWDHTMMAFADVVARHYKLTQDKVHKKQPVPRPIKLMIATVASGYWELMEVFEHELSQRGVPIDYGKECIVALAKPQQVSDRDINILYSACDLGLNTCEGEGWGLCQSEHAAVGAPQVAPKIGGLQEFLHADNSTLIEAKWKYYIDKQRDGIGGIAEVGDPKEYADAIWKYYTQPHLTEKHGKKARMEILQHFRWETVVDHFATIIHNIRKSVRQVA